MVRRGRWLGVSSAPVRGKMLVAHLLNSPELVPGPSERTAEMLNRTITMRPCRDDVKTMSRRCQMDGAGARSVAFVAHSSHTRPSAEFALDQRSVSENAWKGPSLGP